MDIEKLIERLRENTDCWTDKVHGYANIRLEAATALSTLQAENEKLWAELEQVKRERDAAVQCIRGIAKSGRVWMCPYCVHAKDTTGGIAECELDVGVCMMPYSKFEWRGRRRADNLECREVCERQWDAGCKTCPIAKAFDRLAAIEDILGDEYDLERLKEAVKLIDKLERK